MSATTSRRMAAMSCAGAAVAVAAGCGEAERSDPLVPGAGASAATGAA